MRPKTLAKKQSDRKFIKNLSNCQLTDAQVSVISKGLKLIPARVVDENKIRRQLLRDFDFFARRMRLQYIFLAESRELHPFHVKSNWTPPLQKLVALESYLGRVKTLLSEVKTSKPKNKLSHNKCKALIEFKNNTEINLKKADKGNTTVIMNKCDRIHEAQTQLNNRKYYKPLEKPMEEETLLVT